MKNKKAAFFICALLLVFSSILYSQQEQYVKLKHMNAFSTSAEPNQRSLPSGSISGNKEYLVHSAQPGWFQVQTDDGSMGWVPAGFVEVRTTGAPLAEEKPESTPEVKRGTPRWLYYAIPAAAAVTAGILLGRPSSGGGEGSQKGSIGVEMPVNVNVP